MDAISKDVIDKFNKKFTSKLLKNKLFWFFVAGLVVFVLFYKSFFVYIGPDQMGLKQINIAVIGKEGLQEKVYQSGWHFKIPIKEEYILFPKKMLKNQLVF